MVIKSEEQKKRQTTLLVVGLVIIIIAAVVLYFGFWKGKSIIPEKISLDIEPGDSDYDEKSILILEERLKRIDLDFTFLTETILPVLKIHGDLPIKKGVTGRINPFISY